jgi:hypothetical protein
MVVCLVASKATPWSVFYGTDSPMLEIWDLRQGRSVLALAGHTEVLNLARFSPDGRRVLSSALDFTVRQWETLPWRESDYALAGANHPEQAVRQYAEHYWRARLAAEALGKARSVAMPKLPFNRLDRSFWPPRPQEAGPNQVDLTPHYTGTFDKRVVVTGSDLHGDDDLRNLPQGIITLGGVVFDVRGTIVLRRSFKSGVDAAYPVQIAGIKLGRKFKQLHVLHGCGEREIAKGTVIGAYVLHFADGTQQELEMIYGRDLLDFWKMNSDPPETADMATEAWTGRNPTADIFGATARLFRRTYENPKPEVEVVSLDFVSKLTVTAPFLIAITVE